MSRRISETTMGLPSRQWLRTLRSRLIPILTLVFIASAQTVNFPKTGRFIFPASGGRELLSQCSRPAPSEIAGFWQPTRQDIDELETALSKYLEQREKDKKPTPPKANYNRQYVGFMRHLNSEHPNERFIYGNFYPERDGSQLDESKTAIQVCDGGPVFWGIVYHPSTKTFEDLAFNGFG